MAGRQGCYEFNYKGVFCFYIVGVSALGRRSSHSATHLPTTTAPPAEALAAMASSTPASGVEPSLAALKLSDGGGGDDDTRPLLDLLETFPDFFMKEVLERLDTMDRTMLAQVGHPWLAAVMTSGLPRLPKNLTVARRLRLEEFCTSGERLAWAKATGCRWALGWPNCCALAAGGGHLEALQWARANGCPWDGATCYSAARGGHLEVLQWAREQDCPWGVDNV